jgi:hypothetical protein
MRALLRRVLVGVVVAIKVGTFQASDAGVSGLPFEPKLVLVFGAFMSTYGGFSGGEQYMTIGYARANGAPHQRTISLASGWDGLAFFKPHARVGTRANEVISDITLALTTVNLGTLTMTADGFSIAYANLLNGSLKYSYVAIGGDDVTVVMGTGSSPGATGEQQTTGLGIDPGLLLFVSGFDGNTNDGVWWSQGFVDTSGRQRVSAVHSYGDRTSTPPPGNTARHNSDDECIALLDEVTGAKIGAASFVSKASGEYTLDWTQVPAFSADYFYIAVSGVSTQLGTLTQRSSNGLQTVDGMEVVPEAVLFQSVQLEAAQAGTVQPKLRIAIGAGQPGSNVALFGGDEDNVAAWNLAQNVRGQWNDAAVVLADGSTVVGKAAVTDLGEVVGLGGYMDLTWSVTDGTGRQVYWLAIGPATVALGENEPFTIGSALAGTEGPLVAVEFHHPAIADPLVVSPIALADPVTWRYGYKQARLMKVDEVQLALSDKAGQPQANRFAFEIADFIEGDSEAIIRSWLGRINERAIRRVEIRAWMITDRDRRRFRDPVTIFRGRIDEYQGLTRFTMRIECLSWGHQRFDKRVITTKVSDVFTEAPPETRELLLPLALGRLSDEASGEPGPTIIEDDDGRGSVAGEDPIAGFGDIPDVAPPTGVTASEVPGGGNLDLGLFPGDVAYIWARRVVAGVVGEQEPFLPDDAIAVPITGNNAAVLAQCDEDGADAYRFYICRSYFGIKAQHYIQTTDPETGVTFTEFPPLGAEIPITPGAQFADNRQAWASVVAVLPSGRTAASDLVYILSTGNKRPNRFAWAEVADAEYYEVYWRDHPTLAFQRRYVVPTTQINDNGDPYWEGDWSTNGYDIVDGLPVPIGKVIPRYVGAVYDNEGIPWGGFVMNVRPGGTFHAAYLDGVKFDEGLWGVTALAPGKPGYSTYFGADPFYTRAEHRMFMIFLRGPLLEQALDPAQYGEFRVNFDGCEDADDGSGTVISDKFDQLLLLLKHLFLVDTPSLSAAWTGAVPTFMDGRPRINVGSFTQAKLDHQAMVPSGRSASRWIADEITWGQLFAEWSLSASAKTCINEEGEFTVAVRNVYATPVASVEHKLEILDGSFSFADSARGFAIETPYAFRAVYDEAGNYELGDVGSRRSNARATEYDEHDAIDDRQDYVWIDNSSIARQLAQASLTASQHPPRAVQSASVLHWLHLPIGRAIAITHPEGPKSGGYLEDNVQIIGKRIDPHQCTVALLLDDLRKLSTLEASIFTVEEYMATIWVGGSRHDSATEIDTNVVRPINGFAFRIDWDAMPETHGIRVRVEVATTAGSVKPAVYVDGVLPPDPAVVEGDNETSDDLENQVQELEIDRPDGAGEIDYIVLGILSGGATAADVRMHAVREAYQL